MRKLSLCLLLLGMLLPLYTVQAQEDEQSGCSGVAVLEVWARPSTPAGMSAAYGYVVNAGHESDMLVGASSSVAEAVEIHEMAVGADDVMTMQPVEGGLHIPAQGFVQLKPGGYHLMLINLTTALEAGQTFEIDLEFENAGIFAITAVVADPETMAMGDMEPMHDMATAEPMHGHMAMDTAPVGLNTFALEGCESVLMVGGWARPNIGPNSAAYGLLINPTTEDVALTGATSEIVAAAELHTMSVGEDDVMVMEPLGENLTIPAQGFALLQPGGLHLMLINVSDTLEVGGTLDLSLNFEEGDPVPVTVPILDPEAEEAEHTDHSH